MQSKHIMLVGSALAASMLLTGCDLNPSEPVLDGNVQEEPAAAGAPAAGGAPTAMGDRTAMGGGQAMGAPPAMGAGDPPPANQEGPDNE